MESTLTAKKVPRTPISKDLQVRVFRRDRWLCRWCGRPVIFAPAMRYLEQFVKRTGFVGSLAYHDARWRRDRAPLLDHLGAVIDHVEAHVRGGLADEANFVTSCNKCNMRKNSAPAEEFSLKSPRHRVRSKYGEPEHWDGLTALFIVLAEQAPGIASQSERQWLQALKKSTGEQLPQLY